MSANGTDIQIPLKVVYKTLWKIGSNNEAEEFGPSVISPSSTRFAAYTVKGFARNSQDEKTPDYDTQITVRAYWRTLDGTTVYGNSKTWTVNGFNLQ